MENRKLFDPNWHHVEQSKGMGIREYAAHVLRQHEMKEAAKRRSVSLPKKPTAPRDIQNDTCVVTPNPRSGPPPQFVRTEIPPENCQSLWPQASDKGVSAEVYNKLQQIILQSGRADIETGERMTSQKQTASKSQLPSTMERNNDNRPVLIARCRGRNNDDFIHQLQTKSHLHGSSLANSSTPTPAVESASAPSHDVGFAPGGIATQVLQDGIGNIGQRNDEANSDETRRLESCLEAMFCPEASSPSREFANLAAEGARCDQESQPKRPSKAPKKNSLGRGKRQKAGISKKGKPDTNLRALKPKEFICPHVTCGKAFERRYNLKVHGRKHNGQMPYICPKVEEGCFLSFKWRSSLRHHLQAVHKVVVPIAQSNARGTPAINPVATIASPPSADIPIASSSGIPRGSSSRAAVSPKLRVAKNGRIKKTTRKRKDKVRKNFPAVAVREPTAEELARAQRYAELKAAGEREVLEKESREAAVPMAAQNNLVRPSVVVDPEPCLANKGSASDDIIDASACQALDETEVPAANGSQDVSGIEPSPQAENAYVEFEDIEDIFGDMDDDVPLDLELPPLGNTLDG